MTQRRGTRTDDQTGPDHGQHTKLNGRTIAVIDYGIGNLRSAYKAFEYLGADVISTTDPEDLESVDGAVLPGVGAFGPTMDALARTGFDQAAMRFIESGRPFLGICVGMQVLYDSSEESPGTAGLGVLDGSVRRLRGHVPVPQMQWNRLTITRGSKRTEPFDDSILAGVGTEPWMYFVHSYAADVDTTTIATCDYGHEFSAAIRFRNVLATQFHPEKSGAAGLRVLKNFVDLTRAAK